VRTVKQEVLKPVLHSFKYDILVQLFYSNCNSMALVRERTIPTERPPLVGEVNASFLLIEVSRGQADGSLRPYSRIFRPEPLLFLLSSSSVVLNEAEWTMFQTHYFSDPDLWVCSQEL
jgi:hypothetical protein